MTIIQKCYRFMGYKFHSGDKVARIRLHMCRVLSRLYICVDLLLLLVDLYSMVEMMLTSALLDPTFALFFAGPLIQYGW